MKLKITDKTFNKNIDQIEVGELFIVTNREEDEHKLFQGLFMKIVNKRDSRNAVNLNSGELYRIREDMILQAIHGELII